METLDIREIAQEWADELEDGGVTTANYAELCEWIGIDSTPDALRDYGDGYEPTLIAERDFVAYAQELAVDLGLTDGEVRWPYTCIDWERAARELRYDYSAVRFDGTDYLIRAA